VPLSLSILIVLVGAAIVLGPRRDGSEDPEIVARVNGEAVTQGELHRAQADLLALRGPEGKRGDEASDDEELERLAVRQLIQRHLILQEAARQNLSVSDDELDEAIVELRRRFADLQGLGAWMQERGLDDRSLMETIRGDLLTRRVTTALMEGVRVSDEQVRAYYEAHKEDLIVGEEVRLGIIAVDSSEAGEAILTALGDGANFRSLARKLSLGQRAAEGGDTGWVDPLTLPPPLRQAVGRLKKGEAYGPLEKNADEFLVVALAGRRPVQAENLDEARPEIERRLLAATQQRAVEQWLTEQEEAAKIEVFL
jgi:parvulin-like peptidyl-prolyl isomerase